jgi:polysaccharide export outer membrane protein
MDRKQNSLASLRGRISRPSVAEELNLRWTVAKLLLLSSSVMVAGCTSLPTNGPTMGQLQATARANKAGVVAAVLPIDAKLVETLTEAQVEAESPFASMRLEGPRYVPEVVRPSDVLNVMIYEVGVSLFGTQSNSSAQTGLPTAGVQTIPGVRVDDQGMIDLPYIGVVSVDGLTPREIAEVIKDRMRPFSQSPQVLVSIAESSGNSVNLVGAVGRSGRYRLTVARERLRDLLALAGGVPSDPEDIVVRLTRQDKAAEMRLSDIRDGSPDNVYLTAGDQLEFLRRPRTFTVFGASDRVSQIPFGADKVNLLEAVARAGGPSDPRANPRGVFLFRWETVPGGEPKPVIYRLDMMQAGSYFIASEFMLHDKDVLYFANSASNMPTKFISIINQLFSPIVTIRALTK